MSETAPDRLDLRLRMVIAVIGAALCLIGWYRYFS